MSIESRIDALEEEMHELREEVAVLRLAVEAGAMDAAAATSKELTMKDFKIGDTLRFNERVSPKYLIGEHAVVRGKKQVRVAVQLVNAVGRFPNTRPINALLSTLEKV